MQVTSNHILIIDANSFLLKKSIKDVFKEYLMQALRFSKDESYIIMKSFNDDIDLPNFKLQYFQINIQPTIEEFVQRNINNIHNEIIQQSKQLKEDFQFEVKIVFTYKNIIEQEIINMWLNKYNIKNLQIYSQNDLTQSINQIVNCVVSSRKVFLMQNSEFKIFYSTYEQQLSKKEKIIQQFLNQFDTQISNIQQISSAISFLKVKRQNPTNSTFKIGYVFMNKKQKQQIESQSILSRYPLEFIPLDFRSNLLYQENIFQVHGIFQKIIDVDKKEENMAEFSQCIKTNFENFQKKFKNRLIFVDSTEQVQDFSNRLNFQSIIEKICSQINDDKFSSTIKIQVPTIALKKQQQMIDTSTISIPFPVIVKTEASCIVENCHSFGIAINTYGLQKIFEKSHFKTSDLIIQQIIPHKQTIYKIYVIGEKIIVDKRLSLPKFDNSTEDFYFYESQVSVKEQFQNFYENNFKLSDYDLDIQILQMITSKLASVFNLTLFGFDIIVDEKSYNYYIIDFNYFPSYKNVNDFSQYIHQIFLKKLREVNQKEI